MNNQNTNRNSYRLGRLSKDIVVHLCQNSLDEVLIEVNTNSLHLADLKKKKKKKETSLVYFNTSANENNLLPPTSADTQ